MFTCDDCGYKSPSRTLLKRHIKTAHEETQYSCVQCDYKATTKTHLKVHTQKTHEATSYPCDQCDYNATTKLYLSVHTQESHTETVQKIKNNPGKVSSNSSSKTIHTTSQQRERTWRVIWKLFAGIEIIIIVSCAVSRHQREGTWRIMWKLFTRIEVYQLHVLRNIHIK